ncbi:hypothetical protein HDU83_001603 [Entophlyctis luteolus]|nr:hypothetical protein HDU83_001603 [Entophlyctis luteolus]
MLVPFKRENSLLYQSESLIALVEEAEREEEERERRSSGNRRRDSIDTLPVYEPGNSVFLENSDEFSNFRFQTSSDEIRALHDNAHPQLTGMPPGYQDSTDVSQSESLERNRISRGSQGDEADDLIENTESLIHTLRSTTETTLNSGSSSHSYCAAMLNAYRPPGDGVIALAPFVDNNPPSFEHSRKTSTFPMRSSIPEGELSMSLKSFLDGTSYDAGKSSARVPPYRRACKSLPKYSSLRRLYFKLNSDEQLTNLESYEKFVGEHSRKWALCFK